MLAQAILYRGAGFATVWPQFLAIAFVGAALFGFALAHFRRTLNTSRLEKRQDAFRCAGLAGSAWRL